jgi:DNA repair exonuclease SbcCD ATPase subunit
MESTLRQAQRLLEQEESACAAFKASLENERDDVQKLEGLSFTGLFYTVLGTKAEKIDKERQEFLAAKLKYEEATDALDDTRREVRRLKDKLAPFEGVEADYQRLIKEKHALITGTGGRRAEKLLAFSEQLADLTSDCKELREAIKAGESALASLRKVDAELRSAANWGTWDMLGGGMISTMAKHSKIDSAKQQARHAQRALRRFQEELADANQRLQVALEIEGFSKFADYFFDGLIADWVVQSKIQRASSACSSTISRVRSAISECRKRLVDTERDLKKVTDARRAFVEQA